VHEDFGGSTPDVLSVDEKNLREYYVPNITGVVITSNHRLDGDLPAGRRPPSLRRLV
jgi:hypothetical protein